MYSPSHGHASALTPTELRSAIVQNPLVMAPEKTVIEAIDHMSQIRSSFPVDRSHQAARDNVHMEARSSCVLVVENGHILGIFTERDVVRLSARNRAQSGLALQNMQLRDAMTSPIVTLHESDFTDLFSAANLLQQQHIRHIPILDQGDRLLGIITHESLRHLAHPADLLRFRQVSEVMTTDVACAEPTVSMLAIAALMADRHISSVLVVQMQAHPTGPPLKMPLGIITERDIVQFQSLHLDLQTIPVQDVMSTPVSTVRPDDSLMVVQQVMEEQQIRRVVVIGNQGELLGIVTQTSILQALNPLDLYLLAKTLGQRISQLETEKIALLEQYTTVLEDRVEKRTLELKTRAEREQQVSTIAVDILTATDLSTLAQRAAQGGRTLLSCDRLIIWQRQPNGTYCNLADTSRQILFPEVNSPEVNSQKTNLESDRSVTPATNLDPFLENNLEAYLSQQVEDVHHHLSTHPQIESPLIVPITYHGQPWGLWSALNLTHPHSWSSEDIGQLEHLSTYLEIALQRDSVIQQLHHEREERRRIEAERNRASDRQSTDPLCNNLNLLENILDIIVAGYWDWDLQNNQEYLSPGFKRMFGYADHELPNAPESWQRLIFAEDLPGVLACLDRHVQSHGAVPYYNEVRYRHKDGSTIWVICSGQVIEWDSSGQPLRMIGCHVDVTQHKQVEKELRKSAIHLKTAQRIGKLGSWEFDLPTGQVTWSQEVFHIFGRDPKIGTPSFDELQQLIHPDDRNQHRHVVEEAISAVQPFEVEYRFYRSDRTLGHLQVRGEPILDASGQLYQLIGTVLDITARKTAEAKLLQTTAQLVASNQELEAFAYSVSHDLRAPLRAIDGFSMALLEDYGEHFDQDGQDYFHRIRRNISRMGALIDDLLSLSRVSRVDMTYDRVDLSVLVREQSLELQNLDPERHVDVVIASQAIVAADTTLMRVAINNLLQNAWKFTGKHTTARIEFGVLPQTEDTVYFIRDDGAGFDMTYANMLFGVFQRLHNTDEFPGTGIGLATVQRVIHRHGGRIWAESQVEQGATFYFTLPSSPIHSFLPPCPPNQDL